MYVNTSFPRMQKSPLHALEIPPDDDLKAAESQSGKVLGLASRRSLHSENLESRDLRLQSAICNYVNYVAVTQHLNLTSFNGQNANRGCTASLLNINCGNGQVADREKQWAQHFDKDDTSTQREERHSTKKRTHGAH
ncbi:hypothetical protein MMC28_002397 [Mycoblastus sanguinarius]|nr:hypothetical protein [Mycoblastus sanguinarius]